MSDLSEKVYQQFKSDLMNGVFPQDEMIIEQTLVERYGVSRTPVREAAMRLVYEGYLKKYPKKGYTIRCVGESELRELEECRFILESGVIDILIQKASDEEIKGLLSYAKDRNADRDALIHRSQMFHVNMARLTGNENLVSMLTVLLYKVARPMTSSARTTFNTYLTLARSDSYIEPEHLEIVQALLARDAKTAKEILRKDISQTMPF